MVGMVVNKKDPTFGRYFTLEKDYVLKTKSDRTLVCERVGQQHNNIERRRRASRDPKQDDHTQDGESYHDCFRNAAADWASATI